MYNGYDGGNKEKVGLRLINVVLLLWFSFQTRGNGSRTGDARVSPQLSKYLF